MTQGMRPRRMTTRTGKNDVWRSKSDRPSPAADVELALARAASYGAERTRNLPSSTSSSSASLSEATHRISSRCIVEKQEM